VSLIENNMSLLNLLHRILILILFENSIIQQEYNRFEFFDILTKKVLFGMAKELFKECKKINLINKDLTFTNFLHNYILPLINSSTFCKLFGLHLYSIISHCFSIDLTNKPLENFKKPFGIIKNSKYNQKINIDNFENIF
jgi:hypothetical protein